MQPIAPTQSPALPAAPFSQVIGPPVEAQTQESKMTRLEYISVAVTVGLAIVLSIGAKIFLTLDTESSSLYHWVQ